MSDSSSDDEQPAVPPALAGSAGSTSLVHAAYDILARPAGCSLRKLRRLLLACRGELPEDWVSQVAASHSGIELYFPSLGRLPPLSGQPPGEIFTDAKRHRAAVSVPCFRPHPLGNPWAVGPQSLAEACRKSEELMLYGGRAVDWGGIVHSAYATVDMDERREAELDRVAGLVAAGASVSLRCAPSCEARRRWDSTALCHITGVAAALTVRVQRVVEARKQLAQSATPSRVTRTPHVRRSLPSRVDYAGNASDRLTAALCEMAVDEPVVDVPAILAADQPFALAGASSVHVPSTEAPSAFSHRRMERMPDSECLLLPFPVCNAPPVMPFEDPVPIDPPQDLVAYDVSEIVPSVDLRAFKSWSRRVDRSLLLAERGHSRNAVQARPDDLLLSRAKPPFYGTVMDFSVYPFRPLLPSRWPDRPPSTDLRIRQIRREFQAHPDYRDRQLRGSLSHGNPEIGPLALSSFFAAPHASAYKYFETWRKQMRGEREAGWSEASFERSFGLATWPERCQPTSMVLRNGKPRLCHDLSWPKPDSESGVQSPNAADEYVIVLAFLVVGNICIAVAIFLSAGLPTKVAYFDLSKAYKKSGQQRSSRWRRACWGDAKSQTLDRICFGQTDGPSSFTRQTSFFVFIMRRELAYSELCYPPHDARVIEFVSTRQRLVPASEGGELRGETRSSSLSFVGCMIDDFGLVAVDDLLYRADGSRVLDPCTGFQRRRAWLSFEVCVSVVLRLGHSVEPDDPDKFWRPDMSMLYLGARIDVSAEELSFDSIGPNCKRVRYLERLNEVLGSDGMSPADLTSLAFKMLVVCECYPYARQWLHPIFRALRGNRVSRINFAAEPFVRQALVSFRDLLASDERLAVPLASRHSFPFADGEHLVVGFADASGLCRPGERPDGKPGYGAWCVRKRTLYIVHGLWFEVELDILSISVLEFLISFWAALIFADLVPSASHLLEFSDNSGTEWSMRRETPSAMYMQAISARRSAFLQQRGLFSRVCRVASSDNRWADWLSRQRVRDVIREAGALGLTVVELTVPPAMRDTHWLRSVVA